MTPHDSTDDLQGRLIHYVAGELSVEESAALREWIDADPGRVEALAQVEAIWRATEPSADLHSGAWDAEAELRRLRGETSEAGRVIAHVGSTFDLERAGHRRSRAGAVLRVAAAVVLLVGGGLLWRTRMPASSVAPAVTYRTALGQRLSFGLPDGTRVMLAPGSVLRQSPTYGLHDRNVSLDGEAYFFVVHDSTRPFAVHTARAVAHDLGTRFIVRAYPDEATADVVVSEGLVAVTSARPREPGTRPRTDSLVLRPQQRASVTAAGAIVFASSVALEPYLNWTAGQLVFERASLDQVVRRLERWYGVEIRIADTALRELRLTATLQEESAAEALDVVATSLELIVSREGRAYVLSRVKR